MFMRVFEEIIDEYRAVLLKRNIKPAQNLEKKYPKIFCRNESMLERYCELHGVPEEWDGEGSDPY